MVRLMLAVATIGLTMAGLRTAPTVKVVAPQPIASGAALFGEQCATCHGADARGLNGPNLITFLAFGATDERALQTIRNGVPGTAMPPSRASDAELRAILAYLKSLAAPAAAGGEPSARYTPSRVSNLVTVVTTDGKETTGERRNEDAFSIQIAAAGGRLQGRCSGTTSSRRTTPTIGMRTTFRSWPTGRTGRS